MFDFPYLLRNRVPSRSQVIEATTQHTAATSVCQFQVTFTCQLYYHTHDPNMIHSTPSEIPEVTLEDINFVTITLQSLERGDG